MRLEIGGVLALALLWVAACVGTDVGNPGDGDAATPERDAGASVLMDLDFALYDSSEDEAGLLVSGLRIDAAWLTIDRVRLRRAGVCEDEVETDIREQIPVDLLSPGAPERLRNLEVEPGGYCRVEVRWDGLDAHPGGDVPPELADHSLLITGERADGTPFVLRSDRGGDIRLDALDDAEGFPIDEATTALFVALDAQVLFAGVDLDAAQVGSDGVIRIDDDENDDLLDRLEDNLDDASKLFADLDGNRELDDDERAPGRELAE